MSAGKGRVCVALGLPFVLLIFFSILSVAVTIQEHGFVTTIDAYDIAAGKVVGYIHLTNDGAAPEPVQVSAEFYDADGCHDDILANWPSSAVVVPANGSLRVLFRVINIPEVAIQNAHGDPESPRDPSIELSYRVYVDGVMAQGIAVEAQGDAYYDSIASFTQSLPLTTLRGGPSIPAVDMDADRNNASGYACEPYFETEFASIIDVDPNAVWDLGFESYLLMTYHHDLIEASSIAVFDDTGWIDLVFVANVPLGWVNLQTVANFDPSAAALEEASFEIAMDIAGAALLGELVVTPEGSGLKGSFFGHTVAGIPYQSILYFNLDQYGDLVQTGCDVVFTGAEIEMSAPFISCCPDTYIGAELSLDCDGFDELVLETRIEEIPSLPWLSISAELTFAMDEKTLDLGFGASPGYFDGCIDFFIYMPQGGTDLDEIGIAGVRLACEFGGVNFEGYSYPDQRVSARLRTRSINSNLSGDYWEYYRIWTTEEACCGPLTFETAFYFDDDSPMLMDLGAIQTLFQIDMGGGFTLGMALEFDFLQPVGDQWVYGDFYFGVEF